MSGFFDWRLKEFEYDNERNGLYDDKSRMYFNMQMALLFIYKSTTNQRVTRLLNYINETGISDSAKNGTMLGTLNGENANILNDKSITRERLSVISELDESFVEENRRILDEIEDLLNSTSYLSIPFDLLVVSDARLSAKSLEVIPQLTGTSNEHIKIKQDGKFIARRRPWIDYKYSNPAILFLIQIGMLTIDDKLDRNVRLTQFGRECAISLEYAILHPEFADIMGHIGYVQLKKLFSQSASIFAVIRNLYKNGPLDIIEINNLMAGAGDTNIIYVNARMVYAECYEKKIIRPELPELIETNGAFIDKFLKVLLAEGYIEEVIDDVPFYYFEKIYTTPIVKYRLTQRGINCYEKRDEYVQIVTSIYYNSQPGVTVEKFLARKKYEIINFLIQKPLSIDDLRGKMLGLGYYSLQLACLDLIKDIIAEGYNVKAVSKGFQFDPYDQLFEKDFNYLEYDYDNTIFWIENTYIDQECVGHYSLPAPHIVHAKQLFEAQLMKMNHLYAQIYAYETKALRLKTYREIYATNLKYAFVQGCRTVGVEADCKYGSEELCAYAEFLGWVGYVDFSNYFKSAKDFSYDEFRDRIERSSGFMEMFKRCEESRGKKPFILFIAKYADEYFEEIIPHISKEYHTECFAMTYDAIMIHMEKFIDKEVILSGLFHNVINSNNID